MITNNKNTVKLLLCFSLVMWTAAFSTAKANGSIESAIKQNFQDKAAGEFVYRVSKHDTAGADKLLASGVNVNTRGNNGITPLIFFVEYSDRTALAYLLKRKADPNLQDDEGDAAVNLAARLEDSWFLETLLANKGNPNLVQSHHKTNPIEDAIIASNIKNVKILVVNGADINHRDVTRSTPVISAVETADYEIALYLLENGADPLAKDMWNVGLQTDIERHKWNDPYQQKVIEWLKSKKLWKDQ